MLRLNFVTSCVNLLFSLSSVFGISGSLPTLTSSFLGFPGADLLPVTTHLPIAAANPLLIGNLKRIKELTCLPSCPPSLISIDTHPAKAPPGSFVLYSSRKLWLNTSPSNILDLSQCLLITLLSFCYSCCCTCMITFQCPALIPDLFVLNKDFSVWKSWSVVSAFGVQLSLLALTLHWLCWMDTLQMIMVNWASCFLYKLLVNVWAMAFDHIYVQLNFKNDCGSQCRDSLWCGDVGEASFIVSLSV